MKKDLRYLQGLIALNLLPLIPVLRKEYVIYPLWAVSLFLGIVHLAYYLLRATKAGSIYSGNRTQEKRLEFQHFIYKFIIMFFCYAVAGWLIYIGFKYTQVV